MSLSIRARQNVDGFLPTISARMAQKLNGRHDIIDLATAENWLMREELLDLFREKLLESTQSKDLSYVNGFAGHPELIQALALFFNEYFEPRLPVQPAQIATAPGGSAVIEALLFSMCNPGDSVLIMAPYWNGFDVQFTIRPSVTAVPVGGGLAGGICESNISEDLNSAYDSAVLTGSPIKALVICNPHNPFGQCYSREALEKCLRFCQKKDIHLISDEVYALSAFSSTNSSTPTSFRSILSLDMGALGVDMGLVHMVWSISKDFGCSGLRLGCLVSQDNKRLLTSATLACMNQVSCLTSLAVLALMTRPKSALDMYIVTNRERLWNSYKIMTDFFEARQIDFLPCTAGLYVWTRLDSKISTWEEENELWTRMNAAGVGVGAGETYHAQEPGWFRITFALERNVLEKALKRIGEVLSPELACS